MKEIKFRAYHTKLKKMFSAEELGEDQMTLSVDGRGFVNVHSVSTKLSQFAGDKMIPLQFTGLCDRKGTEIYDGDIVQFHSTIKIPDKYECFWVDGGFCFKFRKLGLSDWEHEIPMNLYHHEEIEVVGNVYENEKEVG